MTKQLEGCGCCGIILGPPGTSGFPVCQPCSKHIAPRQGRCWQRQEDRTYFGQYGIDCPFITAASK